MQSHRNVLRHLRDYCESLGISHEDRLTLVSSYCFDAAVMDIFAALLNGATLYPLDLRTQRPEATADLLATEEITVYHSTPSVFRYLFSSPSLRDRFPRMRRVVL